MVGRIRKVISQSKVGETKKIKMSLNKSMGFCLIEAWVLGGDEWGARWEKGHSRTQMGKCLSAWLRNDFVKDVWAGNGSEQNGASENWSHVYKIVEKQEDWLGKGPVVGVDNGVLELGLQWLYKGGNTLKKNYEGRINRIWQLVGWVKWDQSEIFHPYCNKCILNKIILPSQVSVSSSIKQR